MLKNLYGGDRVRRTQTELNVILAAHERYLQYQGGERAVLAHAELSGLNLANRNLIKADFTGASLSGANICGSNLEQARLYCADLRNCNLQLANLTNADLRGASFRDANLSFSVLDQADLRSTMMSLSVADAAAESARKAARAANVKPPTSDPTVDFSYCSMKGTSFGNAKLSGVNFTGALLQGATFKNARLTNVNFAGAVLTGVNLHELEVPPEALADCVLDVGPNAEEKAEELVARVRAHSLWIETDGQQGAPANLDGEDLRPLKGLLQERQLAGLSAKGTNCIGLDFSGSFLQAAKFDGADLREANFSGCDLRGASFRGAVIAHASFQEANLRRLRLTSGALLTPDFSDAGGCGQQFSSAKLEDDLRALGMRTP